MSAKDERDHQPTCLNTVQYIIFRGTRVNVFFGGEKNDDLKKKSDKNGKCILGFVYFL